MQAQVAQLQTTISQRDWIEVGDELPKHDEIVLAWYCKENAFVIKARFEMGCENGDYFDSAEFEEYPEVLLPGKHVSHWMRLPDPPAALSARAAPETTIKEKST